ncbi:glycosyltransferase [Polynucleobacter sp. 30F-ANTBAC]|uniref:glycosyltransferase n=1 Tax=Polynucleobacter sp. 30F-ANTBAC TaxID=2689095 RepID=UPI001C0C7C1E|nr:glycosyltransferase [Polynucleobacter sp. 30F-ANTBAC]MBU3599654.1 glycosyltransferase [Polynucleobacter sp. 30F-ANTBAC]
MKIVAVVVTYNSELDTLKSLINSLPSDITTIVSDNSTDSITRLKIKNYVSDFGGIYLDMIGNKGLGCAQNVAIKYAKSISADFVLFMDDDSVLKECTLKNLINYFSSYYNEHGKEIIVCANPLDIDSGLPLNRNNSQFIKNMMNSGSLISINILNKVGYFDEDLFIDYVDYDFGWRAISQGVRIKMVDQAFFYHKLGDSKRKILGFDLKISSPIRHYYQTRNTFLVFNREHVPYTWKINRMLAIPVKFLLIILFADSFTMRLGFYCKGLIDGFLGKTGDFNNNLEKVE